MSTEKKVINTVLIVLALLSSSIALMFVAPGGQIMGYGVQYIFLAFAFLILVIVWGINRRNNVIKKLALFALLGNTVSLIPLSLQQDLNLFSHSFGIVMISCAILLCLIAIVFCWLSEKRATTD
ncbi:MAG: hypothetical protein GQ574_00315 [Crocinitomix sp.]|nr:hypothetical protein [Crocinitomix sp.]